MNAISPGALLIARERLRQLAGEGFSPDHDRQHTQAELATAARCYITAGRVITHGGNVEAAITAALVEWPFEREWLKVDRTALRNFEKAGALLAAQIDRDLAERATCTPESTTP